jgi:hypothetical protein
MLLATLTLAQAGCGSDSQSQESGAQLSKSQLRQLERLYEVQVASEKMMDGGMDRRALERIARGCAAVDDGDPLLAIVVNGCGEATRFAISLASSDCDSASDCTRMLRTSASETDELARTIRRDARRIADLLGDTACTDALTAPRELDVAFETLGRALREMATAIESGDDALMRDATESLEQGEQDLEKIPSATALLERFREACA